MAKKTMKKVSAKAKKKAASKTKKRLAIKKNTKSKSAKAKTVRKPNAAFMRPVTPSTVLAAIIGADPKPRTEITKKIWDYIKKNNLQDEANKRIIKADERLRALFGKAQVTMFELTKIVSQHLK